MRYMKTWAIGCLMSAASLFAQEVPKEVLFTVNDTPFYTDEFARVYLKNLDLVKDDSQRELNQYYDLFVGYKLKVQKAFDLGLHKNNSYLNELGSYREQLSRNYVADPKVTQALLDEAYARTLQEVNASHILILSKTTDSPADTLKAYKKILDVYAKVARNPAKFEEVARQFSEDPSAKSNGGNLGYFTAFRMVYPFENAAYTTPKGEVSKPFRSQFGYHIVKVNDLRTNRGELTVAHIMTMKSAANDAAENAAALQRIRDIQKKLQQGEQFEELARQFSEDKSSSDRGGRMQPFWAGQLNSLAFEEAAFALSANAPYSDVVESDFGYHLIQFVDIQGIKPFDELRSEIEAKVHRDERSRKIENTLLEKLHKSYTIKRNDANFKIAVKAFDERIFNAEWTMPEDTKAFAVPLLKVQDSTYTIERFMKFAQIRQRIRYEERPLAKTIEALYRDFENTLVQEYYTDHLEYQYPEFAQVMMEYRDGLLLFDLMDQEIWKRAKTDSIGLESYYKQHQGNYQWNDRVNAILLSSTDKKMLEKGLKLLKKGKSGKEIELALNTNDRVNIMAKTGVMEVATLPAGYQMKKGVSKVIPAGDYFYAVNTLEVKPAGAKTLDEARGRVISDYQTHLEENWVGDLSSQYTVRRNEQAYAKVKKYLEEVLAAKKK